AAVADLALGKTDKTAAKLQAAENLETDLPLTSLVRTLEDAIFYNRALLDMAAKGRAKNLQAFTGLEKYLLLASPDSAWWPLAYEKYEKLSKSVALPPLTKEELRKRFEPKILRLVASIKLAGGATVTLGESVEQALARCGDAKSVKTPVFPGAKILRIHF